VDEATLEILLKWKQENERVFDEVLARLATLNTAQTATNASLAAQAAALATAPTGWWQLAVFVGIAAVALAPIAALILSAAVALISFTVGAAGFLTVAGLMGGAFAAIGAGVLLLGGGGGIGAAAALATATTNLANAQMALSEASPRGREAALDTLAKAQLAYNDALARSQGPVGVLLAQLTQMKQTLADQAAPLAAQITQWVGGAIPAITQMGQAIMTWFGERLPGVLSGIGRVLQDLRPAFNDFGNALGNLFDRAAKGNLGAIFEDFARFGMNQVIGLLTNLVRLSEWFQKELPGLKPIVSDIFGYLGTKIQDVAGGWAGLTDWVKDNWKKTLDDAGTQIQTLGQAFKDLADPKGQFQNAKQGFQDFGAALKDISSFTSTIVGDLGKINAALQPIADVLDRIGSAFNNNGLWLHSQSPHISVGPPQPPTTTSPTMGAYKGGGNNITIHVNGAKDPWATGAAVTRQLRGLFTP
jgi:hypothetical protein